MTFDGKAFGQEVVAATKAHIEKTVAPLLKQIEALKAEIDVMKAHPQPDVPALISQALDASEGRVMMQCNAMVDKRIELEIAAQPKPQDGKNGADGKDADPSIIKRMVTEAVMALPPAQNGKDADPELVAALVKSEAERILAGWQRPQDGKSVTAEEFVPLIEDRVLRAVSAIPVPKDGKDGLGAVEFLTKDGHLLVTMSNGTVRDLGIVQGKDGVDGLNGKDGIAGINGKDGRDGVDGKDGRDGIDGQNGERGLDGAHGLNGKDGVDGLHGKDGADGLHGKDGADGIHGKDGVDGLMGNDGIDGLHGKDGRDGLDVKDLFVIEGGEVIATFSDGRMKNLGPFRGKDGEPGKDGINGADGNDGDLTAVSKMIEDAVAKVSTEIQEFAPDEVAVNVAMAVKKMAETTFTAPVTETKESVVHFTMPTQPAPIINMAAPIVNIEAQKRGKEITKVTGHDNAGRITEYERREVEDE